MLFSPGLGLNSNGHRAVRSGRLRLQGVSRAAFLFDSLRRR